MQDVYLLLRAEIFLIYSFKARLLYPKFTDFSVNFVNLLTNFVNLQ